MLMLNSEIITNTAENFIKEKPYKIGIVAYQLGENSFGITKPYYSFFSKLGDVVIIHPLNMQINKDIDLLVLPGGPDVDPIRYGARPSVYTGKPDIHREWFDMWVLPRYIKEQIPVFGICRGHQTLAVHFGAKLYQHIWHPSNEADKRYETVHSVHYNLFDNDFGVTKVNSIHHQVVASIPENGKLVAFANTDKFQHKGNNPVNYNSVTCDIEALYYPEYKCASVQWHPEELDGDIVTDSLINWLLTS